MGYPKANAPRDESDSYAHPHYEIIIHNCKNN